MQDTLDAAIVFRLLLLLSLHRTLCHSASMRTIRRYSNRKLYDSTESHYVTLNQICDLIRSGEEIRVIQKDTGEDLTTATMAQIIFEQTKSNAPLSVEGLRRIIVSGLPVE
jgi:polyhydroxyalkanoate synthesis repressor PhaR